MPSDDERFAATGDGRVEDRAPEQARGTTRAQTQAASDPNDYAQPADAAGSAANAAESAPGAYGAPATAAATSAYAAAPGAAGAGAAAGASTAYGAAPRPSSFQPAPEPAYARAAGPAAATVAQPAPKRRGWIVAIVAIVAFALIALVGLAQCSRVIDSVESLGGSKSAGSSVPQNAVATITIDGTIGYDGTASSPEGLKTLLDQAENDSNIKAVVLRVNSGGGTATAGEEMAAYVRDFSKPVVVSSASMNASAAYEISSQADYIFVNQTTEIGAIGTIMTTADLSGLLNKLGVSTDSIASADSKDSSYGLRPLTDDERAYYQQMVDEINQTFLDNVASGRPLTSDQVNELATGMPFTGTTAVTNGIADAIGTREDAERKAADLAGINDYNSYSLALPSSELDNLTSLLSEDKLSVSDVEKVLKQYESEGSDVR